MIGAAVQSEDVSDDNEGLAMPSCRPVLQDYGADEETMERLAEGICHEDLHNASFSQVAVVVACKAEPCRIHLNESIARRQTPADVVGLGKAMQKLKDKKLQAMVAPPALECKPGITQQLCIDYDSSGRPVQARVLFMTTPALDNGLAAIASVTVIPRGQSPPFVLLPLDELPTLDTTIGLHRLCKEQEVAFRIIMGPLLQAMEGIQDVQQLKFAVLGTAGALIRCVHVRF